MLAGRVDELRRDLLRGWARDDAVPDAPVALVVTAGSRLVGHAVANRFRPDLLAAGIGDGRFGFAIPFDPPLAVSRSCLVHVRAEATGEDVPGSPVRLPAATEFDAGFRRSCAAVLDSSGSDAELDERIAFLTTERDRLLRRRAERRPASRGSGRRALVIDQAVPRPDHDGGSAAIVSHMRALRRLGFDVVFTTRTMGDGAGAVALEREGFECRLAPFYGSVEEVLRCEPGRFDLVYLHRLPVAAAYSALVRQLQPGARMVYAVADLHHLRLLRQAAYEDRPELAAEAERVRAVETWCAGVADAVITHSAAEAELLRSVLAAGKVHVAAWSAPARPRRRPFAERAGAALLGDFAHQPNSAAAAILRDDILPALRRSVPSFRCVLAGDNLPDVLRAPSPGLDYVGHVADLDAFFDTLRLTVAPLPFGAGLKGKVLSSMAAGLPCVCSPVAAEGMGLPHRLSELVAPDLDATVRTVLRLHEDEAFNARLSRRCLAFAGRAFSDDTLDADLARAVAG